MPIFGHAAVNEFAPFWRLLDEHVNGAYAANPCDQMSSCKPSKAAPTNTRLVTSKTLDGQAHLPSYQPRFDVKEFADRYELVGELPGVAQENIDIEFTDPQTLKLSGHSIRSESDPAVQAPTPQRPRAESSHSLKASVEDATDAMDAEQTTGAAVDSAATSSATEGEWTPVASPTPTQTPAPESDSSSSAVTRAKPQQVEKPRYWLSERQTGRFQRTFNFPGDRIDTDHVKAALTNGLLTVVIPKAPAPAKVKISIQ